MNSKYFKFLPIFIIFLLGGISLTWTNNRSLLNTGDFLFPTDGMNELYAILHSWDKTSLGAINYFQLGFVVPYGLYLAFMRLIGASAVYSQMLWNYFLLTAMGLSMYFLVTSLIKDEFKYLAGLIAAIFFMFNPWSGLSIAMFFPYITFIPLMLGLYIKGLNENKDFKYLVLFSLIWWFVLSFSLRNFRGYIFLWMLFIFYLLYFIQYSRTRIRQALIFSFSLGGLHILLNSHWLLLFFSNILKSATNSVRVYESVGYFHMSSFGTASSKVVQALRLIADWSMTTGIKGVLHFPWLIYYQHPLLIFIGFLLLFSVLVSFLFVMKGRVIQNRYFIFFFILLLFGYFISMGKFNPLGMWLATKFQVYLLLFKTPSEQSGLIFILISYSVLIAYSFVIMSRFTKSIYLKLAIGALYILIIMIYGYPIWSGKFIPAGNKLLGAGRYEIPKYILDLKKQVNNESLNYRLFSLPFSKLGYFAYDWAPGGYNGPDPLTNILFKSQIMDTGLGMLIADTTTKNIDKTSFFRLNSLLNVKYIMNKRDANLLHINNNSWYTVPDPAFLNSLYQNTNNVSSFGQIDLIKIPDELFLPKLYTPLKVISINSVNELPNIVSQKNYQTRSAIYVDNYPNTPNTPNIPNASEKTTLEYRMISPVKYRVKVHNALGSFPLVMSETFHEGWKLYSSNANNYQLPTINYKLETIQGTIQNDDLPAGSINETWFKKPAIEDSNHLMVNGYANSWIVDANKICNNRLDSRLRGNDELECIKNVDGSYDFELIIEFWPQRPYYLGLAISLTTLLSCIGYLIIQFVISKKPSDSECD